MKIEVKQERRAGEQRSVGLEDRINQKIERIGRKYERKAQQ